MEVSFLIKMPVCTKKDGDFYVSYCPPLDIYSQGHTKEEAFKNIKEAVNLFIVSCFERGTLDKALKECGFRLRKRTVKSKPLDKKYRNINIPIPFTVPAVHAVPCHA